MFVMQSRDEIAEVVLRTMQVKGVTIKELAYRTRMSRFKVGRFLAMRHPLDTRELASVLRALELYIEVRQDAQYLERLKPPHGPDR